jgi:2,7-dihydroxy-5-methyl-1-naphthoate 7-O-methyltransferase
VTEEATGWGGGLWAAADLVTPMAIRVAATLRLADHIAAGTQTTEALAEAVDADQDALGRLLGHLVTAGVLSRAGSAGTGTYSLTALGEHLRDDDPAGVRSWIDLEGAVGRADLCLVQLLHTVRTGEPAFPRQFGRPFWDDLSADSGLAASFDALMEAQLVAEAPAIAAAYPWGTLGHVVDVGGGNASLLIAILRAHGDLRGTVIDLAGPVARAEQAIVSAGLGHRAGTQVGSFFDALPAGAGGYVLSAVLHDWDDEDAVRILRRCADAASETGRVLVVEHIGDAQGGTPDTEGDLRMLCYFRGRERTLDQLGELAKSAGLQVSSVTPAGSRSIIEMRPSH